MRNFWTWLIFGLIATCYLQAEFTQPIYDFEITGAYRLGTFDWGIASPEDVSNGPPELWSQKFRNVKIYEITAAMNYTTCNNYYIRLNGNAGQIWHGISRSTGYGVNLNPTSTDNREFIPISKINGEANRGCAYEVEGCFGYQFTSNGRRFVATPVLGWNVSYQHFKMRHGHQELEDAFPISGHKMNYKPRWWGPFFGVDWMVAVEVPCFIIFGKVEYHFSKQFRAKGNWNRDPYYSVNFRDRSKGTGLIINLGGNYEICNGFFVGVIGEYKKFHAGRGTHRTGDTFDFLPDAISVEEFPAVYTKLRYAKWTSFSVAITLDFRYWSN